MAAIAVLAAIPGTDDARPNSSLDSLRIRSIHPSFRVLRILRSVPEPGSVHAAAPNCFREYGENRGRSVTAQYCAVFVPYRRPAPSGDAHERKRRATQASNPPCRSPRFLRWRRSRDRDRRESASNGMGLPVYVRHEIVHNHASWLRTSRRKAQYSSRNWTRCPKTAPVIFSAHGVPKSVPAEAERREMIYVDATCPLVSKVHREAERHHAAGRHIPHDRA